MSIFDDIRAGMAYISSDGPELPDRWTIVVPQALAGKITEAQHRELEAIYKRPIDIFPSKKLRRASE